MRLASLKGGRDGRLAVVGIDLASCTPATAVAPTLQAALDDWDRCAPQLERLARELAARVATAEPFDPANVAAPLPRAYQWADGSAYVNHTALVRRARGAQMPESFWTEPLMYQGGSDGFIGAGDPIFLADEAWGCDLEAEVAVIVGDVPQGSSRDEAASAIRLVTLVNDVSLRHLIPAELAKGFGFFQSKPASAFAPVAVTPDELGGAWRDGKLHGVLEVAVNDRPLGQVNAGVDMTFDFPTLIAHAAKTRSLTAGTVVGSGTVSNRDDDGGPGRTVAEGGRGYGCLAELRTVETLLHGAPQTEFLRWGDTVRIEMLDATGRSIFGSIAQTVARPPAAAL